MNKGFSFIEVMVVTAILSVVLGAIFAVAYQAQMSFESEKQFTDTSQQARMALDQIVRHVRQAGNDPLGYLKGHSIPAVHVGSSSSATINSDITGSFDGTTGDPDGALNSPLEIVSVNYNSSLKRVTIDINDGRGPQTMADNIEAFNLRYFDKLGAETTVSADVTAVRVEMTAATDRPDRRTGKQNSVTLRSDVFIRSKSFDMFAIPGR